jgi:predicted secreted protein
MATAAIAGVGTIFKRASSAIAEVNSIAGPTFSRNTIDATSLDSAGGYKEFIAGMRDAGEVTLNMNFAFAGWAAMKADFESNATKEYSIVLPDTTATTLTFDGLVTAMPFGTITPDDKISVDVTIKISGMVDVTT